jgi:hypothetical protein
MDEGEECVFVAFSVVILEAFVVLEDVVAMAASSVALAAHQDSDGIEDLDCSNVLRTTI